MVLVDLVLFLGHRSLWVGVFQEAMISTAGRRVRGGKWSMEKTGFEYGPAMAAGEGNWSGERTGFGYGLAATGGPSVADRVFGWVGCGVGLAC